MLGYSGYNWLQGVSDIFCSWVYQKTWFQWVQLVTRVTGIFSVYNMGYIIKLGYNGLQIYLLFLGISGTLVTVVTTGYKA